MRERWLGLWGRVDAVHDTLLSSDCGDWAALVGDAFGIWYPTGVT